MKELIAAATSLGVILFAALAFSAEVPFNQAQFDAARASGKPIGSLSRTRFVAIRGRLMSAGHYGKHVFGLILVVAGCLIATGLDKSVEAWLLDRSPDWLTHLTTRF